jgi:hypothetical protein
MLLMVVLFGGCAHLPDAQLGYYHARSKATFKVVRTVGCDASNNIIVASAVTPTVTHLADRSRFFTLNLTSLKGSFSDSDVKIDLYEDGRLKGVNTTVTGQGETILKTATTIIAALVGLDSGSRQFPEECGFIKSTVGEGKALSVTYEGEIDPSKLNSQQSIPPDVASAYYAVKLAKALGAVFALVQNVEPPNAPLAYTPKPQDVVLHVRQPGTALVRVSAGEGSGDTLWDGSLVVAQVGKDYTVPIPAGAIFGKEVFAAAFLESGAVSTLQYAKNTDVGQALNVASSVITAAQGKTTAQKVEELKGEADLILQQQRLVQCMADPKNCK